MAFPSSLGKAWLLGASLVAGAAAAVAASHDALSTAPGGAPTAKTANGTYAGVHLPEWDQDAFLGMPFAQAPVGALRWRPPQSINASFDGVREATRYGASCMQYNAAPALGPLSEDCLTINVVRPTGLAADSDEPLPVLVWIYGGGLFAGSTADPQYNLSGIVAAAQAAGRPFVGVSMNYRLGMWGFLATPALVAEGSTNLGLRDQRLALRWIQENIGAFGGDASRVTLWGESAGAQSIAYHMFAHGGRDDDLFRAAILESGGPTGAQVQPLSWYGAAVENLTRAVGCWGAQDQLKCLRAVDATTLFEARPTTVWNPLLDGDLLQAYPSQQMAAGAFVRVPLLTGANTDEAFSIGGPLETEADLFTALLSWRSYALTPPTIRRLLALYPAPANCTAYVPYHMTDCARPPPGAGAQWRRAASIGSDLVMIAQRRRMAELLTAADQPVYSYRFDQLPAGANPWDGVRHFVNVAYSFQNVSGLLPPSGGAPHAALARAIGTAYARFVAHLDPNDDDDDDDDTNADGRLPHWPRYSLDRPTNMVLNATRSWVEADTWRGEALDFINSPEVTKELLG